MDFGDIGSLLSSMFSNQNQIAGGSLLSAFGALQQGQAGASAATYNARMAESNAALSAQQGDFAASLAYNKGRRVIAQETANYGASGVTMDGSPLDVLADSTRNVISDTLMARVPYATRSAGLEGDATLDRAAGRNSLTSSYFRVGTDLSQGAMRLKGGGGYYNFSGSGDGP